MKTLATLLFLLAWREASSLRAQESEINPMRPNVIVEMQIVALPREIALPLIREMMDKKTIDGARARVQDLLEKGTAKLLGWPTTTTRHGARAVIEATDEYRYPVMFEAGGRAVSVTGQVGAAGADGRERASMIVRGPAVTGTTRNSVAKDFETRNLGVTLGVEPWISPNDQNITLNVDSQHLWLKAMTEVAVESEKTEDKVVVEQPEVNSTRVVTSLTVRSGKWILLGVSPAPEGSGDLELFLLRAEIRKFP
jgi:hypothetical protein